jgi:hypothetical protein
MGDDKAETKAEAEGETKHRHLLIDPDDLDTVISTKWLIDGLVAQKRRRC